MIKNIICTGSICISLLPLYAQAEIIYEEKSQPTVLVVRNTQSTPANQSLWKSSTNKSKKFPLSLSGNFDITTNYVWRGITQSNNAPAFQGGLTIAYEKIGLYFNIWGSNINFPDPYGVTATVEADPVIGISNEINDYLSYDLYVIRYVYFKTTNLDYNEYIGEFSFWFFTLTGAYSNNVFDTGKNGEYFRLELNAPIHYLHDLIIVASAGRNIFAPSSQLYNYDDYMIGIQKAIGKLVFNIQWITTKGSYFAPNTNYSYVVGTITAEF